MSQAMEESDQRQSSDNTPHQVNAASSTTPVVKKDDTFRVRGIPLDWDADRLQSVLKEHDDAAVPVVRSLALEIHGRSLSATVNFEHLPSSLQVLARGDTWDIPLHNKLAARPESLSLDADFYGMTTLFAPPMEHHKVDVVAISGLGGHAFGSFKKRGGNFMWLRDALPFDLKDESTNSPMARVVIYGYNSTIANSHSTQNLEDLATAFHTSLRLLAGSQKRPIILVAHSLGGLVVKQTLITLSQSQDVKDQQILQSTYGIAFFAVPHHGMSIQSLIPMAGDGPNRFLIESLSDAQPQVLRRQHQDFLKALGSESKSEVVCFYETLKSPTAEKVKSPTAEKGAIDKWAMTGPPALLVTSVSATNCRPWESGSEYICAINRTHSELVKFSNHDSDYDNTCERLRGLAHRAVAAGKGQPEVRPSNSPRFFVPRLKNQQFIGREDELARLRDTLFSDNHPETLAIFGLGGIGKTQIALQMVHYAKAKDYWSVFWLPAISLDSFEQECLRMVQELSIPMSNREDPKQLMCSYLESSASGRWLLIIDNADDAEVMFGSQGQKCINSYLPQNDNGCVLFTTRTEDLAYALADEQVELDKMSPEEAEKFLRQLLPKSYFGDNEPVGELLQELVFLPLAISHAAAYIKRNRASISRYLSLFQDCEKEAISLLSREFPDRTRYGASDSAVMSTWLVSFRKIRNSDSEAAELLSFISQIEARAIPESILPQMRTKEALVHAVGTLCGYAFFQRRDDGKTFDMHRLVHLAACMWVNQEGDVKAVKRDAMDHLTKVFHGVTPCNRDLWLHYMPHVLRFVWNSSESHEWEEEVSGLRTLVAILLMGDGRSREAVPHFQRVVEIHKTMLAESDLVRLTAQNCLATAYLSDGQIEKAMELLEYVDKIQETTLVESGPDRLQTQHTLARVYIEHGQTEKAIALLKHVASMRDITLTPTDPDHLTIQCDLAQAYLNSGQIKVAIELMESIANMQSLALGQNDPGLLITQSRLAEAYLKNGQEKDGLALREHMVQIMETIHPENHPLLLWAQNDLAVAHIHNHQYKKAVDLFEYLAKMQETAAPENDPSRLKGLQSLAFAYYLNNQAEKGVDLMEEIIRLKEMEYESGHPSLELSRELLVVFNDGVDPEQ